MLVIIGDMLVIPEFRRKLKRPKGEARRQGREKAWMDRGEI